MILEFGFEAFDSRFESVDSVDLRLDNLLEGFDGITSCSTVLLSVASAVVVMVG